MKPHKLEIYRTAKGFRWRVRARNGRIIDAATETFTRYRNCRKNVDAIGFWNANLVSPKTWKRGRKLFTDTAAGGWVWL